MGAKEEEKQIQMTFFFVSIITMVNLSVLLLFLFINIVLCGLKEAATLWKPMGIQTNRKKKSQTCGVPS